MNEPLRRVCCSPFREPRPHRRETRVRKPYVRVSIVYMWGSRTEYVVYPAARSDGSGSSIWTRMLGAWRSPRGPRTRGSRCSQPSCSSSCAHRAVAWGRAAARSPPALFNPALKARPSRAASGRTFALRGGGVSSGICNDHQGDDRANPPNRDVSIALRQRRTHLEARDSPRGPEVLLRREADRPHRSEARTRERDSERDSERDRERRCRGGAEEGFAVLEKRTAERTEGGSGSAGQRVLRSTRPGRSRLRGSAARWS